MSLRLSLLLSMICGWVGFRDCEMWGGEYSAPETVAVAVLLPFTTMLGEWLWEAVKTIGLS